MTRAAPIHLAIARVVVVAVVAVVAPVRAEPGRGDFQLTPLGVDILYRAIQNDEGGRTAVRWSSAMAWTADELPFGVDVHTAASVFSAGDGFVDFALVPGVHVDVLRVHGSAIRLRAGAGPTFRWSNDVVVDIEAEGSAGLFLNLFGGAFVSVSTGFLHLPHEGWVQQWTIMGGVAW